MANELAGKVAVVTGGASGIGRGTVEKFVAEGARVVIADVDRERGEPLAGSLGSDALFKQTDVARPDEVRDLVSFSVERFGGLHVMFNNAGVSGVRHSHLVDEEFADFERVISVNLLGVMVGTQQAARHMAANGGGSIINTTSIGGMQPGRGMWAYHASKAAVIMFSKSAAIDLGADAIRVNCIAPGNIETPILSSLLATDMSEEERAQLMSAVREFLLSRQPLKRQGTPADIAEAAVYLGSDRSSYVTGTVLPVDGGLLAGSPASSETLNAIRKRVVGERQTGRQESQL